MSTDGIDFTDAFAALGWWTIGGAIVGILLIMWGWKILTR